MPFASRRIIALVSVFLTVIAFVGCAGNKKVTCQELSAAVVRGDGPRSIAVLPFINETQSEELGEVVRINFYSHLCARSYQDIELALIDDVLLGMDAADAESLSEFSLKEVGRQLGCDAIVMGKVTQFHRVFAGVYSQMNVGATITVVDVKTGDLLWEDRYVARSHQGGLPLNLLYIPLVSVRSGLNLTETAKTRAVDKLCRELVGRMPAPAEDQDNERLCMGYEVQAGAFLAEIHAAKLVQKLREKGFPAFIRETRTKNELWKRVLLGPYEDADEATRIQQRLLGELKLETFINRVPLEVAYSEKKNGSMAVKKDYLLPERFPE